MKKLTAGVLCLILPLTLCVPAAAEEIPDGFSFGVEIVGTYTPEPEQAPEVETPTPEAEESTVGQDGKSDFDYTLESFAEAFTAETNKIREEHGLPTFEMDGLLTEMAQARMDESEHMDHKRPDGSDPTTIFPEYGSELRCTGENMGAAGATPENFARAFMTTSHRKNILNPDAKYMGVGVKWVDTVIGPRIAVLQLFATDE